MGRRNKKGRNLTGMIVIDKPTGRSSNHVLQQVRRLFDANKAGHTGNLDPLATGVLPICLGEATKISSYLLNSDKRYQVTCQLGPVTDSGDADGQIIKHYEIPSFTQQQFETVIASFVGEQQQVPPMFSALKHQGQPLYKLARQGIEVERKSRTITIYEIRLIELTSEGFSLEVSCSKGTYIRTLVEDICYKLGTGGHVTALRRIAAAGYEIEQACSLEQIEQVATAGLTELDKLLLPVGDALIDWPEITVSDEMVASLRHGQTILVDQSYEQALVKLYSQDEVFLGIGEMSEQGVIAPKRVFVSGAEQ